MMESTTKQVKVQTLFPPFCRWRRSGLQVKAWTLLVQHWLLLWSGRDGVKFAHVVLKYFRAQWVPGECSRAWWELFKSKHECLEDSWFRISDHQTPSPLYNATVSTELCKSIQLSETGPIIGSQWDPWDPGGKSVPPHPHSAPHHNITHETFTSLCGQDHHASLPLAEAVSAQNRRWGSIGAAGARVRRVRLLDQWRWKQGQELKAFRRPVHIKTEVNGDSD